MLTKLRRWLKKRRILGSAIKLATLLMVASILAIVLAGLLLGKMLTLQTVAFAVLGAILQSAFLGLVYEVWLRSEVEDATLEKLGTSKDVREHGLIRLDTEAKIDWSSLLEGARELTIVARRPEALIGNFDDFIMRCARDGALEDFRVAIPADRWEESLPWCEKFKASWSAAASASSFFAVKVDGSTPYDILATESRSILLLHPVVSAPGLETLKLLEFRKRNEDGIGAWLARQKDVVLSTPATFGYSPPVSTATPEIPPADVESTDEEKLT
ncbi:hypothetical protein FB475_3915 [Kribbella jejuensis]|uniref:Uncharacterized protein n=2 Tax=Kribbella jejuensis TaxID=236068 RepID=A0A542EWK3_9ACTN|nr:hypothetical protein FB475_3915 [Kribbella jejuensis]